ncbi:MAG TPA: hypothetical protein VMT91_00745 [Anaerolineales bacterium]|nr:hypothetical protein [Anaerolineales bacterium]
MIKKKTFRIFVILAILVGMIGFAMPAAAAGSDIVVSYTLPTGQINAGTAFDVVMNINVSQNEPVTGLQFDMNWTYGDVHLVSVTKGDFFTNCSIVSSDYYNAPLVNNTNGAVTMGASVLVPAATAKNYSIAGLGIPAGQGCFNSGTGANSTGHVLATFHFMADANGKSVSAPANIIFSDVNSYAYTSGNYTFPGFFQWVGSAPHLVVQNIAFTASTGVTPPNSQFTATVTVANTGASANEADSIAVTFDSNSTNSSAPLNITVLAGDIGGNTTKTYNVPGTFVLNSGQINTMVTAALTNFPSSLSSTYYAAVPGTIDVDGQLGSFITVDPSRVTSPVTFTTGGTSDLLGVGLNTQTGNFNVQSNTTFAVSVFDNQGTTWHMTKYSSSQGFATGLTPHLSNTLSLSSNPRGSGPASLTNPGGLLLTGDVSGMGAGNSGENFTFTYSQTVVTADPFLTGSYSYHLTLTYYAYMTA